MFFVVLGVEHSGFASSASSSEILIMASMAVLELQDCSRRLQPMKSLLLLLGATWLRRDSYRAWNLDVPSSATIRGFSILQCFFFSLLS